MRAQSAVVLAVTSISLLAAPLLFAWHESSATQPFVVLPQGTTASAAKPKSGPLAWPRKPLKAQEAEGGIWRIDNGFQPMFMLKNALEIAPITVTPVLFMEDGTEYDLTPVQLDPSGTAMVNIRDALQVAPPNVQSHISTYGSASMRMQWAWPGAVRGAIRNTDEIRGLIYQTHLQADTATTHNPLALQAQQILDAIWWKQESHIDGFLTLMNSSLSPITATVEIFSSGRAAVTSETFTINSHNTQWIDVSAMWSQLAGSPNEGGIRITYNGMKDGLLAEGGLEDDTNGYSHMLHFWPSSRPLPSASDGDNGPVSNGSTAPAQTISYDSAGLMVGKQGAEMLFPAGTIFTPYVIVRNNSTNNLSLQLAGNCTVGNKASDFILGSVSLAPQQTQQVNIPALLSAANLSTYEGFFNFKATFAGNPGDLLLETGSVDQSYNFVFEVPPAREQPGGPAQNYSYWNSGGDTDTMVTLWNYSNQDQDFVVTFFHQQGKYEMPVHLAAHATYSMSMAALIRSGTPDRNGVTIPSNIFQGSAKVSGTNVGDHAQKISVAVSIATYNSRTGTCNYPCEYCDGPFDFYILPTTGTVGVGLSTSFTGFGEFYDGTFDVSALSEWSSEDDSVASASDNDGTVVGVAAGSTLIDASYTDVDPAQWTCQGISGCTNQVELDDSATIDVTPTITSISPNDVLVGSSNVQVTISGTGFSSPTVNLPAGVTGSNQASNDTQIIIYLTLSINASIGPNSITVTSAAETSNQGAFTMDGPDHMIVEADTLGKCSGCTTAVARDVKYQVELFSNSSAGTIPIGETPSYSGWNCSQSNPGNDTSPCSLGDTTESDGTFTDEWTMSSDVYSPSGCGFNITDQWRWCATTPARSVGSLTGYVHTNAIKINGVVSPPNSFTIGTIINP